MTDLSPAAKAIEDAYFNADGFGYRNGLAAALRAAADQCKLEWNYHLTCSSTENRCGNFSSVVKAVVSPPGASIESGIKHSTSCR